MKLILNIQFLYHKKPILLAFVSHYHRVSISPMLLGQLDDKGQPVIGSAKEEAAAMLNSQK